MVLVVWIGLVLMSLMLFLIITVITAVNWWERSAVSKNYNNDVELNGCYCETHNNSYASLSFACINYWDIDTGPYTILFGGKLVVEIMLQFW